MPHRITDPENNTWSYRNTFASSFYDTPPRRQTVPLHRTWIYIQVVMMWYLCSSPRSVEWWEYQEMIIWSQASATHYISGYFFLFWFMKDLTFSHNANSFGTILPPRWHHIPYGNRSSLSTRAANGILIWITLPDMLYAILISFHVVSVCSLKFGEQSQVYSWLDKQ